MALLNRIHMVKEVTSLFKKKGIYELLLIQKKTMTISEFRKKAIYFNKVTEGKKIEEVERDVII